MYLKKQCQTITIKQNVNFQLDRNGILAAIINPLIPHDALKHHFESLNNGLISYTWCL